MLTHDRLVAVLGKAFIEQYNTLEVEVTKRQKYFYMLRQAVVTTACLQ